MRYWNQGEELNNSKYVVEKLLGKGGFGVTYKIKHTLNNTLFALKTLNIDAQNRSDFEQLQVKFINEAIALASCRHPNIVRVYPQVFQQDGLWCMVMEYVEGEDLACYLDEHGKLTEDDAIAIITKVGKALSYVHQQGFLHRDIKPANILLRKVDLSPVLIDFGLAREYTPGTIRSMTNSKTERYAPIEQYQRNGNSGAWTDVYALAATLYALLTERPPIPSDIRKEVSSNILIPPKQHNPKISDRINEAILKGMEIEPGDRPQSVEELINLLLPPPTQFIKEKVKANTVVNEFDYLEKRGYRIIDCLRTTGFCETYLAQNFNLPQQSYCIVKKLYPQSNENFVIKTARRLFDSEARILHKLKNYECTPNLLAYFETNNYTYQVHQYVDGKDLSENEIIPGKQWEEIKITSFLVEALEILVVVHQNNIIHRDIKPSNFIRRSTDGKIFLIDFGASKKVTDDYNAHSTINGKIANALTIAIGTPGYMSSEQQRGDPRFNSDIYSLGIVAIQAFTGNHPDLLPRDRDTGEIRWRDRAPQCGQELGRILDKMVRNNFLHRYKNTHEVIRDLKQQFQTKKDHQKIKRLNKSFEKEDISGEYVIPFTLSDEDSFKPRKQKAESTNNKTHKFSKETKTINTKLSKFWSNFAHKRRRI